MKERSVSRVAVLIGALALFFFALANFSPLGAFVALSLDILAPVCIGLALAFIFNIPLSQFEGLWIKLDKNAMKKGHAVARRAVCLFLCIAIFIVLILSLSFAIIPQLETSLNSLLTSLPKLSSYLDSLCGKLCAWLSEHGISVSFPTVTPELLLKWVRTFFVGREATLIKDSIGVASSLFSGVFDVLLALVICIYVLARKETLANQLKRLLYALLNPSRAKRLYEIAGLSSRSFSAFIAGQFLEGILLGILCFIGMIIFRMPFATLISVIIGVSSLVPIFGAFFGIGLGAFFILLVDPSKAFWFVVFIVVLQQIESNLLYPKLMGQYVGLPAVWVLIAVSIGSSFGVLGILVGVPIFSVLYSLSRQFVTKKEQRYHEQEKAKHGNT